MMAFLRGGISGAAPGGSSLGMGDGLLLTGITARMVGKLYRYSAVMGLLWLPYAGEAMPLFGVGWQLVCAMAGDRLFRSGRLAGPARRPKAARHRNRDCRFTPLLSPSPLQVEEFPFRQIWRSPKPRAKFVRRQLMRMNHQPFKPR